MLLRDASFLGYYNRFPARHPTYAVFEQRIICPTLYAMCPARSAALFMPSDFLSFGLTADLLKLWDIPLAPEPETSRYFEIHPERRWRGEPADNQFFPEQYIWVACLRKYVGVPFRDAHDFSAEAIRVSDLSLVNNFILLEMDQIRLEAPRHHVPKAAWASCFSHAEWLGLYRQYCDPAAQVPIDWSRPWKRLTHKALLLREKLTGRPSGVRLPAIRRV
jgi:hypothetical protein